MHIACPLFRFLSENSGGNYAYFGNYRKYSGSCRIGLDDYYSFQKGRKYVGNFEYNYLYSTFNRHHFRRYEESGMDSGCNYDSGLHFISYWN